MKNIIFDRKTIDCDPFQSEIITEDERHYYFNDKKGFYTRIKKEYENYKYTINLNYKRYVK